jgi:hypothetical protein
MDFEDFFKNQRHQSHHHGHEQGHRSEHGYESREREHHTSRPREHQSRHGFEMDMTTLRPMLDKVLANKPLLILLVLGAILVIGVGLALLGVALIFAYKMIMKTESWDWHSIFEMVLKYLGLLQIAG